MAFNSLDYSAFLCLVFVLFWQLLRYPTVRTLFLLGASYFFYAAWNGWLVLLIVVSTTIDFACGALIARFADRRALKRTFFLISVVANLAILGFFKYANFFIDNLNHTMEVIGWDPSLVRLDLLLPIGISFYTFQSLSYTLDIYLGKIAPTRSWKSFFLFVAFFPQLVAGPIVRARELLPQLERAPELSRDDLAEGVYLLLRGIIKKMVIADFLAHAIVDPVFSGHTMFSSLETFVALVAFHYQVYCDFSGYTDIALGSARLFGLRLPDNFDTPYLAHTPANFWRRWHMTLSRFAFDYIYKPMGGSKRSELRTWFNLLVTFGVIGFWHGASWTYVLFGLYHAVSLLLTRVVLAAVARARASDRRTVEAGLAGNPIAVLVTNLVIILALPLFRSADVASAVQIYGHLFAFQGASVGFSLPALSFLAAAILLHYVPLRWEKAIVGRFSILSPAYQSAAVLSVAYLVFQMSSLAKRSFVYFQF
jgi:D-alanyl-lipoteichoic acid acyltransferase DltB (MBOAT superfamily)